MMTSRVRIFIKYQPLADMLSNLFENIGILALNNNFTEIQKGFLSSECEIICVDYSGLVEFHKEISAYKYIICFATRGFELKSLDLPLALRAKVIPFYQSISIKSIKDLLKTIESQNIDE